MQLYEMNRLKSDFLATVSHELRTPLNSILGFSDVLSGIDALDDKQQRYVGNIQRSGRMLLDMINDILDLAKMESGKMEVRLERVQDRLAGRRPSATWPGRWRRRRTSTSTATPRRACRRCGRTRPRCSRFSTTCCRTRSSSRPKAGGSSSPPSAIEQGDLRLTVADTGIGISPDEQQLVFEKFRQASGALPDGDAMTREYSGTGLGLSIVRELCRLLGGDVSLESELGKGSTFTVRLPWRLEETPRLDAQLREDLEALTRTARVADALPTAVPNASKARARACEAIADFGLRIAD